MPCCLRHPECCGLHHQAWMATGCGPALRGYSLRNHSVQDHFNRKKSMRNYLWLSWLLLLPSFTTPLVSNLSVLSSFAHVCRVHCDCHEVYVNNNTLRNQPLHGLWIGFWGIGQRLGDVGDGIPTAILIGKLVIKHFNIFQPWNLCVSRKFSDTPLEDSFQSKQSGVKFLSRCWFNT